MHFQLLLQHHHIRLKFVQHFFNGKEIGSNAYIHTLKCVELLNRFYLKSSQFHQVQNEENV